MHEVVLQSILFLIMDIFNACLQLIFLAITFFALLVSSAPSDEGKENISTLTESSETSPSVPVVSILHNLQPGQACGVNSTTLGTCEPQSRCALIPDRNFTICVKEAKTNTLNQTCGGSYGFLGKCREGLRCTADEEEYERGANITGVCYQPNSLTCLCKAPVGYITSCGSRTECSGDNIVCVTVRLAPPIYYLTAFFSFCLSKTSASSTFNWKKWCEQSISRCCSTDNCNGEFHNNHTAFAEVIPTTSAATLPTSTPRRKLSKCSLKKVPSSNHASTSHGSATDSPMTDAH